MNSVRGQPNFKTILRNIQKKMHGQSQLYFHAIFFIVSRVAVGNKNNSAVTHKDSRRWGNEYPMPKG